MKPGVSPAAKAIAIAISPITAFPFRNILEGAHGRRKRKLIARCLIGDKAGPRAYARLRLEAWKPTEAREAEDAMFDPSDLAARRERLAAEMAKLDALLAAIKDYATEFAPDLLSGPSVPHQHVSPPPRKRIVSAKPAKPTSPTVTELTADAAAAAMESQNKPLSLAELEEVVRAAGVHMPDTDNPRNVVGARLYNSGRFQSLPHNGGWWFKDRSVPKVDEVAPAGVEGNEAPSANAKGASETGEAATSPIENRPGFRLVG